MSLVLARVVAGSLLCLTIAQGASLQVSRKVPFTVDLTGQPPPIFRAGHILARSAPQMGEATLRVWDLNASLTRTISVKSGGISQINIRDVDMAEDGRIAIAASAIDENGQPLSFIGHYDAAGNLARLVRTSPFSPSQLAFASDGTLWAAGWVLDQDRREAKDYDVVRHYDRQGLLQSTALPRSLFGETKLLPAADAELVAGDGFVALLSRTLGEVTLASADSQPKQFALPPLKGLLVTGAALLNGDLYLSTQDQSVDVKDLNAASTAFQLRKLDLQSGSLSLLDSATVRVPNDSIQIIGLEGGQLVVRSKPSQSLSWLSTSH
jgi:hypothetical protein